MADKNTIKDWFKTGKKPTQSQFWATWDSFWHKDEAIPQSSVQNLGSVLDAKAEQSALEAHINDRDAHGGSSLQLGDTADTAQRGDQGKTAYDHSQASGNPHNTTKAQIGLGNVDNTSDANKPVSTDQATAIGAKLTGTIATDAETQITAPVTEDNKFVSRLKLFNWWVWVKSQAQTFASLITFNAGIKLGNLTATNTRVAILNPDGTLNTSANLYFDPTTRTIVVGTTGNPGKLDIWSTIFKLKVQSNITSGNATIEFNAGQDDALSFVDTAGTKYITLKSTTGGKGFISLVDLILDQGIYYPLKQKQGLFTSSGAGVKVYAKDSLNTDVEIPFATDTWAGIFEVSFILKNSTAATTIAGKFKATAKRAGGTITVTQAATEFITNAANPAVIGMEAISNNSLKFYFTPNASDSSVYTGAITEVKYSIN